MKSRFLSKIFTDIGQNFELSKIKKCLPKIEHFTNETSFSQKFFTVLFCDP